MQDQEEYFLALFFLYKQLNYRFCWENLMQPIESLYMWKTAQKLQFWQEQ